MEEWQNYDMVNPLHKTLGSYLKEREPQNVLLAIMEKKIK